MTSEEYGGSLNVSRIRAIKARGGRLTGDMVAALIDDEDDTYRACRCGHIGAVHFGGCACGCATFIGREE